MVNKKTWLAAAAATLCAASALAQATRPDAGSLLESPRQLPSIPGPGGAAPVVVPQAPAEARFDTSVRVTPTAFRIQGNTVFSDAQLQAVLAPYVNKSQDMGGLQQATGAIRSYYRERGYPVTEAYLPQQQFSASGGTVTIHVLEGRIGQVRVKVEGAGVSESLANQIVHAHLRPGDPISEYALEKPILLLRDLPGWDAAATVAAGRNVGEGDITVTVKPYGKTVEGSVGIDNYGVRAAGNIRAYANVNANNLTGRGDLLGVRLQKADQSGSELYRLGYSMPVGGYVTKLGLNVARNEYALGKQFAALGASGVANVYGVSAIHPFIRSRAANVLGAITFERKSLEDSTSTPLTLRETRVNLVRLTALGNFVDRLGLDSFNSYAVSLTNGKNELDPAATALDIGAAGLNTTGSFSKVNVEFARTMYFSAQRRITGTVQSQFASKNLVSAEKFTLGGITGVRGYPAGEAVGDAGTIINVEFQQQLPNFGNVVPLNAAVFYDWGHIRYNQRNTVGLTPNEETLRSAGFGLTAGLYGNYLVSAQLAWRLDRIASTGDPDKRPRVWLSAQKWF